MFEEIYLIITKNKIGDATELHKKLVAMKRDDLIEYFIENSEIVMPYIATMDAINRGEDYIRYKVNYTPKKISKSEAIDVLLIGKIILKTQTTNIIELKELLHNDKRLNKILENKETLPYMFDFFNVVYEYLR